MINSYGSIVCVLTADGGHRHNTEVGSFSLRPGRRRVAAVPAEAPAYACVEGNTNANEAAKDGQPEEVRLEV